MKRLMPIACGQVATLVFGVISLKLISRLVAPEVNGLYQLFLGLTQASMQLSHSGLYNHALRYWQRERPQQEKYARFLWRMNYRAAGPLALIILVMTGALWLVHHDSIWLLLYPLLFLSNLSLATFAVASGLLNVDDRRWTVCGLNFAGGLFRALLPAAFALLAGASLTSLAGGFTAYTVALVAVTAFAFRRFWATPKLLSDSEKQWLQEMRDYGRPYFWMGIGGWLLLNADRWVVVSFFGEHVAGQFGLAGNLSAIIPNMAVTALLQLVMPRVFLRADQARTLADWNHLARYCDGFTAAFLAVSLVGLGALDFVGPNLIGWLIDPKYGPAMPLILPVGLAAVSVQVNQFHYLLLQGQHDSASMIKVMLVVSGVKTVGSIVAAWISWECFLAWLMVSVLFSTFLGRGMIRVAVFRRVRAAADGPAAMPQA